MSAARSLWRALAATLQVAALVAFVMSSPGHAHVGAAAPGIAAHGHGGAHGPGVGSLDPGGSAIGQAGRHDHRLGGLAPAQRHDGAGCHGPCSCTCGCQSVPTGAVAAALPSWKGRPVALRPPAERAFSTLTLEILPRPPRTFA